ncbi:hypothetical protein CVT26_002826, partial [Gymnopilus dilepis]
KRGCIHLKEDEKIEKFIERSTAFHEAFGDQGVTFREAGTMQITYPLSTDLAVSLGQALAFSSITKLNIQCGHDPEFLQGLREWDVALGRLRVLRIKYKVFVTENDGEDLPWEDPMWTEVLSLCLNLEVFMLKTLLYISSEHHLSDSELPNTDVASSWAQFLPSIQRIYLFHSSDDACNVGDNFWMGSNSMLFLTSDGWSERHVRPRDFPSKLPFARKLWQSILAEDLDPYDSDHWAGDEEDGDAENGGE